MTSSTATTDEVLKLQNGDRQAGTELARLVYQDLRALAQHLLAQERPGHTLQATALVHEAYLRLVDQTRVDWRGRAHFFAVAALVMRRILVQHARERGALKRGGGLKRLSLDLVEVEAVSEPVSIDLVALDDALNALAEMEPGLSRVVELRFFAGLTIEQCAEVEAVSVNTIKRRWAVARTWLQAHLED